MGAEAFFCFCRRKNDRTFSGKIGGTRNEISDSISKATGRVLFLVCDSSEKGEGNSFRVFSAIAAGMERWLLSLREKSSSAEEMVSFLFRSHLQKGKIVVLYRFERFW